MKKICVLLLAVLLLAVPALASAQQGYIYVPKTETATLRKRANAQSPMVKRCKPGVIVEILGSSRGFYKINYKGTEGYVVKGAIQLIEDTPLGRGVLQYKGYTTGSTKINIRQTPKKAGALCGEWETGTEVEVFSWAGKDYAGKWYEIQAKGIHGFVQAEYLTLTVSPEEAEAALAGEKAQDPAQE